MIDPLQMNLRYSICLSIGFFISNFMLSQPGGGGGIRILSLDPPLGTTDSILLQTGVVIQDTLWVHHEYTERGDITIHPLAGCFSSQENTFTYIHWYNEGKNMQLQLYSLPQENGAGYTPSLDTLSFRPGYWSWNLSGLNYSDRFRHGLTSNNWSIWASQGWVVQEKKLASIQYSSNYYYLKSQQQFYNNHLIQAIQLGETALRLENNKAKQMSVVCWLISLYIKNSALSTAQELGIRFLNQPETTNELRQKMANLYFELGQVYQSDSLTQIVFKNDDDYFWVGLQNLARHPMDFPDSLWQKALSRLNSTDLNVWEGKPIGIFNYSNEYWEGAVLAFQLGKRQEGVSLALAALETGSGYTSSSTYLKQIHRWLEQYPEEKSLWITLALAEHHRVPYSGQDPAAILEIKQHLENYPDEFKNDHFHYWWCLGLLSDLENNQASIIQAGKKLRKLYPHLPHGDYLLMQGFNTAGKRYSVRRSEHHRIKFVKKKAQWQFHWYS
jgi:tetratricopeptide (TPR) repeat protein